MALGTAKRSNQEHGVRRRARMRYDSRPVVVTASNFGRVRRWELQRPSHMLGSVSGQGNDARHWRSAGAFTLHSYEPS